MFAAPGSTSRYKSCTTWKASCAPVARIRSEVSGILPLPVSWKSAILIIESRPFSPTGKRPPAAGPSLTITVSRNFKSIFAAVGATSAKVSAARSIPNAWSLEIPRCSIRSLKARAASAPCLLLLSSLCSNPLMFSLAACTRCMADVSFAVPASTVATPSGPKVDACSPISARIAAAPVSPARNCASVFVLLGATASIPA